MSSVTDQLIEIEKNNWPILRDLYKVDWPKHHVAYNIIQNYINWFEKDPNVKYIKVYSLNGDWSDGTFVIVDRYNVPFCTLNENLDRLARLLNLLNKSISYNLYGYINRVLPAVQKYFEINNWAFNKNACKTIWYHKEKEEILQFKICVPENVLLKPLKENDAKIINEVWPHRHPGSLNSIKRLIRYNISLGVYRKDTGELMAWCLCLVLGSLGTLQVKEQYTRQGLGILLVKSISKALADSGMEAVAPVVEENIASGNMFKKLGFKEIDIVYWNRTKSSDPNHIWKDSGDE